MTLSRLARRAAGTARWAVLSAALIGATTQTASALPSGHGYAFDRGPSGGVSTAAFPKWTGAMGRNWAHKGVSESVCNGKMGRNCGLDRWRSFLSELDGLAPIRQLRRINAFVNQTRYRSDSKVWGRSDYWAAPGEFFARGGDCEDYAIAKYYSLKSQGFAADDMRIVVLKDTARNLLHAVLVVKHGGRTLVLDNLSSRVKEWKDLPNYKPLYSVNEKNYWLHPGLKSI